jgi:hypothetical protein
MPSGGQPLAPQCMLNSLRQVREPYDKEINCACEHGWSAASRSRPYLPWLITVAVYDMTKKRRWMEPPRCSAGVRRIPVVIVAIQGRTWRWPYPAASRPNLSDRVSLRATFARRQDHRRHHPNGNGQPGGVMASMSGRMVIALRKFHIPALAPMAINRKEIEVGACHTR